MFKAYASAIFMLYPKKPTVVCTQQIRVFMLQNKCLFIHTLERNVSNGNFTPCSLASTSLSANSIEILNEWDQINPIYCPA